MGLLFDWILIICSSIILWNSYKRIIYIKNTSISNYIIVILYAFFVLPILLNYLIGIPAYRTVYWYKPFIAPMHNETISVIYDIYILMTCVLLYFTQRKGKALVELHWENSLTYLFEKNKSISLLLIVLPALYILITGRIRNFMIYAADGARGLTEDNRMPLLTPFMLLSMFVFFSVIFKGKMNRKKIAIIIVYSFAIIWISGKRFMIANILTVVLFYAINKSSSMSSKRKLFRIIPVLAVALLAFSGLYLVVIKPLSDTSLDSVYEMLRVDFGRDDVVKYVIEQEVFKGNRILNYRGESFLGLLASFIPRRIWKAKPYPHYMYLTSSILGVNMFSLPAGTTPSLMEMTICNFGILGFLIAPILLVFLCRMGDRVSDIDSKAIVLILYIVLLTQSMDVYLVCIVLLWLMSFVTRLFHNKRVRIVFRKR